MKNLSLIFTLLLCSCASIIDGENQNINIVSNPPGANCTIVNSRDTINITAPSVATVKRSYSALETSCEARGYGVGKSRAEAWPNWWVAANVFNLGLGYFYDIFTGAAWKYPDTIKIVLPKAIVN